MEEGYTIQWSKIKTSREKSKNTDLQSTTQKTKH